MALHLDHAAFVHRVGDGPVAAHPREPRIAWAEANVVWEWSLLEGARRIAWLPLPVQDLGWDERGELWILDAASLRSRAAVMPAPPGELALDPRGVGVAEAHYEDGVGPTAWIHRPDGTVDVVPGAPAAPDPGLVGTPDGRFIVTRRDGLRAIWELPR